VVVVESPKTVNVEGEAGTGRKTLKHVRDLPHHTPKESSETTCACPSTPTANGNRK